MSEKQDTGPSASTGVSQRSELAALAHERVEAIVAQALMYAENTGVVIDRMEHEDVFPFPLYAIKQRKSSDWSQGIPVGIIELEYPRQAHLRGEQTVFRVGTERVPDWLLGFTTFDQRASLPDDGTIDDIKAGVLACLGDCVVLKARAMRDMFERYDMETTEFVADFLTGELTVYCTTQRSCISVNGVMSNHRVRKMMVGKVTAHVSTYIERGRRTDGHLGDKQPKYQEITRTFIYRDQVLVHNEPQNWSAGTTYANGDCIKIGSMHWSCVNEFADSSGGGDDARRFKERAALGVRERAYAQAARNR
jgi:hypothetical protein